MLCKYLVYIISFTTNVISERAPQLGNSYNIGGGGGRGFRKVTVDDIETVTVFPLEEEKPQWRSLIHESKFNRVNKVA